MENDADKQNTERRGDWSDSSAVVRPDWCPKHQGNYFAYNPEYWDGNEWRSIPTESGKNGIPQPNEFHGGLNNAIGMFGYEQAQALAWSFAALSRASGRRVEVRTSKYEVVFEIKARALEA